MARNIFQDGMAAFDDSYDRTAKVFGDVARRKAGAALATGDRAGAAGALGADGEVDAVRTLQRDQAGEDQQAYENKRQQTKDQQATMDRSVAAFKQVSTAARNIDGRTPEGLAKRKAFILEALPAIGQQTGADMTQMVAAAQQQPPEKFDDTNLQAFDGELDKHTGVRLGSDGYGDFNERTGDFVTRREPTQKAPTGFEYDDNGNLAPIPGYVTGRKAIADATRAPPRPKGPPGGGHYGATPHGPVVQIPVSDVTWSGGAR